MTIEIVDFPIETVIFHSYVNVYQRVIYLVAHPTNRKWVITPVINGISRVNPLITGVISHLLSGMSHQVPPNFYKP